MISVDDGTEKAPAIPTKFPSKMKPRCAACNEQDLFPFTGSAVDTIVKNTPTFARTRSEAGKCFFWFSLKAQELYSYITLVI